MPVKLVNSNIIEVFTDQTSFSPTAEEIYSVVFEDAANLRGVHVSKEEFVATVLDFSREAADPLVVLESSAHPGAPEINCRLVARQQTF